MLDKPLTPPTDKEVALSEDLKWALRSFSPVENVSTLSSEMEWASNLNRLREMIISGDPREFLRWDVIRKTMFVSSGDYLDEELAYLQSRSDWDSRWYKAIKETETGHPPPYLSLPETSGNLIHHAYHIAKFEEKGGRRIDDIEFAFEFGGGYGSMCRLFHNLGYTGKYLIFDFPFFSALQTFFLKSIDITVCSEAEFKSMNKGVLCLSEMDKLPNFTSDISENTMFIATWSISETPLSLRNSILPLIGEFTNILIAYQHKFGEVDNIKFFEEWSQAHIHNTLWTTWPIQHLPGNRYLVGVNPGAIRSIQ